MNITPVKNPAKYNNELNKTYGRRTVIQILGYPDYDGHLLVLCKCECGKEDIVRLDELKRGKRLMCLECGYKHQGESIRTDKEALYDIWRGMRKRCNNKNHMAYNRYGGRGITVCEEWNNKFEPFYNWAINNGFQQGLSIDRINSDGNYEPNNCRWATQRQQVINRGVQCNNKTGYAGIRQCKNGKYSSHIKVNYKTMSLGTFNTKQEALNARNQYIINNKLDEIGYKIQQYINEN